MSMQQRPKISAYVITYNEEKNIKACLESIKWVDELIIIDSYSMDNTVNIARNYTNNILLKKFDNDYGKLRNYAISRTKNDWLISIDGDELLSNGAEYYIRNLIINNKIDGFWFPRKHYINRNDYLKHGYFYPDWQLRLFKNKKNLSYNGFIHEFPNIPIKNTKRVKEIEIIHNESHTKFDSFFSFRKFFPYIVIEGKEFAKTTSKNSPLLIKDGVSQIIKEFYWSFIKYKGYKDGYPGFRAALIYALYKGSIKIYASYKRIFS